MLRKKIVGLLCVLAFVFSVSAVYAQQKGKQAEKKVEKAEEKGAGEQEQKVVKKGPEKVYIYNGEQVKVQLYGFVRLDGVYHTRNVVNETGPLFVSNTKFYIPVARSTGVLTQGAPFNLKLPLWGSMPPAMNRGSLTFDVRWSRIGLNIFGPKVLGAETSAQIEADFWGTTAKGGNASRQGMLRMRAAWAKIEWKGGDVSKTSLLFGQWWSAVMALPCAPLTLDYLPFFEKGFLYDHDQQILLSQRIGNDKYNFTIDAAIARNRAGNDVNRLGVDIDSSVAGFSALYPGINNVQVEERGAGEAMKKPAYRGRLTLTIKPSDMFGLTLGSTASYQKELHGITFGYLQTLGIITTAQQALLANKIARPVRSYSVTAFAALQIAIVQFVGVGFMGENLDQFIGGLNQGAVDSNLFGTKLYAVPIKAGFVQCRIALRPVGVPLTLAVGMGKSMKKNDWRIGTGQIVSNQQIQGLIMWHMNDYLSLGFEVSEYQTKYNGRLGSDKDMSYRGSIKFEI